MQPKTSNHLNAILQNLPSIDEVLRSLTARRIALDAGERQTAKMVRRATEELRQEFRSNSNGDQGKEELLVLTTDRLDRIWRAEQAAGTRRVINATGVVIHTNLGRSPLSELAREAVQNAAGYCSLEYDTGRRQRGRRGQRVEELMAELTGVEDVLIVNNCAAAAFFVLSVFAAGGEVVISRGELVEIGGDFRVPDVLAQSGATLCEVGTTNRTKVSDYEKAIGSETRLILRVHPSNYKIVGFTASPDLPELATLAHKHGLLLYEDIGSGALIDLSRIRLIDEPIVGRSIADGADIVTFSGDKLLGGPQSGIIAGKKEHIDRLRSHPLYRALRVDKLAYAALEGTLNSYSRDEAFSEIPVLRMMSASKSDINDRATRFIGRLAGKTSAGRLDLALIDGVSAVGGGAAPAVHLETVLIGLTHPELSVRRLEESLRKSDPPVICRIVDDRVMIDLRTVAETEEELVLNIIATLN